MSLAKKAENDINDINKIENEKIKLEMIPALMRKQI